MKPAIEGGPPVRHTFLDFHRPSISEQEINNVVKVLRSGWLTMGPRVIEFEDQFKKYVGSGAAIAVNSCTGGLHITLSALGIGRGDEVITSPFTFTATANVIVLLGAKPIFSDILPDTFNINPSEVKKHITKRTKLLLPIHFGGQPCDMDELLEISKARRILMVEDAAHAFGAVYHDKKIGTISDATVFSFYATKNITTGEGGMITTDNTTLADSLRILRLHGISKDAWKRYGKNGSWYYEVEQAGFKYNMTDIQAALGIGQLKNAQNMQQKRSLYAKYLSKKLCYITEISLPYENKEIIHAWHLFPILLDLKRLRIDRSKFIDAMKAENIGTSVHFIPLHLHPFYRKKYGFKYGDFPIAENIYERTVSLPLYPSMKYSDLDDIVEAIEKIVNYFKK